MHLLLTLVFLLPAPQDLSKVLARADELLEEAKKSYEAAKASNSLEGFVQAAFALEEARIKYLVLIEVGQEQERKTAGERLRQLQQLAKLVNDGRAAAARPAASEAPAATPEAQPLPGSPPPPPPVPVVKPDVDVFRRLPVPDAKALQQAETTVRDLFKSEFTQRGGPAQKALANSLMRQAGKLSDDVAGLYAVYKLAIDAAIQGEDVQTALVATYELSRIFNLEPLALKSATLTAAAKAVKTPEASTVLAEAWLQFVWDCANVDDYEGATKAAAAALAAARKTGNPDLVQRATARSKDVAEMKSKFTALQAHRVTLAKTPDHPGANLEMGQFLCFLKGEWELGIRFLAKGSDAALKAAAEGELKQPPDLAATADQWLELAGKEKSALRKGQILSHAKTLYETALSTSTGLARLKIEKRLEELGTIENAPSKKGPIDLLALIDVEKDKVVGTWKKDGGGLTGGGAQLARIQIPYSAPDEYDLLVVAERRSGSGSMIFGLNRPSKRWAVVYDTIVAPNYFAGLDSMDGKAAWGNPSTVPGKRLKPGKTHTFEFRVRKTGISTTLDGEKVIAWEGDYGRLDLPARFATTDPNAMVFAMFDGDARYTQIKLTPVSGEGKRLR